MYRWRDTDGLPRVERPRNPAGSTRPSRDDSCRQARGVNLGARRPCFPVAQLASRLTRQAQHHIAESKARAVTWRAPRWRAPIPVVAGETAERVAKAREISLCDRGIARAFQRLFFPIQCFADDTSLGRRLNFKNSWQLFKLSYQLNDGV
jgi:hypothetical protein